MCDPLQTICLFYFDIASVVQITFLHLTDKLSTPTKLDLSRFCYKRKIYPNFRAMRRTPSIARTVLIWNFRCYECVSLRDSLIPLAVFILVERASKTSETFKTLLLSLCISDLGVGFLIQPLYVAYLTMEITKNSKTTDNTIAYWAVVKAYAIPHSLFVFASFFGVFAITVDRFLAIHLHLRYQELVTHKRVVAVVISFWVFSVIACFWYESISVLSVMSVVCIITTGLLYCKIYAAVRHHTRA